MKATVKALVDGYDEFIGIDHHKKQSYITIKNREGEIVKKGNVITSHESISQFLDSASSNKDARRMAVMECGRCYRPMYRWLTEEMDQVVLANPGGLKIISETVYKDDEIDSNKLTELLMLGMVPEAHAASDEAWERRRALRHRMQLVEMQTRIKNRIHVVVDLHPDAQPPRPESTDLFSKVGLCWLHKIQLPKSERVILDELLEVHEYLKLKIARSDSLVRKIVKEDKRCHLLMTIPGIGPFFSALIMAEVDDINRFLSPKAFASYIGLVPGRDISAGKGKGGRIHKRGNKYLRWALVEAAIPATSSDLALKYKYENVKGKGGQGANNKAKVAVANKLSWIVYRILKEERPYEKR